jgi:hypothetical protein
MARMSSRGFGVRKSVWGLLALSLALLSQGCGIYTFSGSTLPGHLKTLEIPLFANQTLQSGVAEQITTELSNRVLSTNLLRTVTSNGDASLGGVVTGYATQEYQYDIRGDRKVDVEQYLVTIVVSVEFLDRKKSEPLYQGVVRGQGVYAFGSETEAQGRQRAVEDVVRQILENSLQSW